MPGQMKSTGVLRWDNGANARGGGMKTSLVDRGSVERLLLLVGALRSGLVDALAGGEALSGCAGGRSAGADPRATGVVLEALAAEGVVERVSETGGGDAGGTIKRFSTAHARGEGPSGRQGPELERSGLLHQVNKMRGWLELPEVIRSGRAVLAGHWPGSDVRSRALAMGERDPEVLDEIVERCFAYAG